MGTLGPLPWKVMGHIMTMTRANHKSEGLQGHGKLPSMQRVKCHT